MGHLLSREWCVGSDLTDEPFGITHSWLVPLHAPEVTPESHPVPPATLCQTELHCLVHSPSPWVHVGLCIHICAYFILFMHMSGLSQALLFYTLCNPGSLCQLMLSILQMISEEIMQHCRVKAMRE